MSSEETPSTGPATDGPPFIGALLRLGWQRIRTRLNAAIVAAGFDDLHETHFPFFSYPAPDAIRPAEVARRMGMSRQAANHLLSQLEQLGYIERRAPAGSERRLVYLTGRGWQVAEVIFACLRTLHAAYAREIGAERFAEFLRILRRIALEEELGGG